MTAEECENLSSKALITDKEKHEQEMKRARKVRVAIENGIQEARALQEEKITKIKEICEERLREERMFGERMRELRIIEERMRTEE